MDLRNFQVAFLRIIGEVHRDQIIIICGSGSDGVEVREAKKVIQDEEAVALGGVLWTDLLGLFPREGVEGGAVGKLKVGISFHFLKAFRLQAQAVESSRGALSQLSAGRGVESSGRAGVGAGEPAVEPFQVSGSENIFFWRVFRNSPKSGDVFSLWNYLELPSNHFLVL